MTSWLSAGTRWSDDAGWGMWLVVAMCVVALWGLVAAIVVALTPDGRTGPDRVTSTALQALSERFARGEIDEAEYEQRTTMLDDAAPESHQLLRVLRFGEYR